MQCINCGSAVTRDDVFCGTCGSAVCAVGGGGPPAAEPVQVGTVAPPGPAEWSQAKTFAQVPAARAGSEETAWWQAKPEPVAVAGSVPPDQFFGHAASQPGGPLSNATRYLCAAAYLDPNYSNKVIGELTASHRAVAPSLRIDRVPFIRHSLTPRKPTLQTYRPLPL